MGKGIKRKINEKDENEFNLSYKHLSTSHIRSEDKRLIIILEGAQLETVKVIKILFLYLINNFRFFEKGWKYIRIIKL